MGTELLDIHLRIEKRFGIALTFDEVRAFTTVGDIADSIVTRVAAARRDKCVMLPAFMETRRFVRNFKNDPTFAIRPAALMTRHQGTVSARSGVRPASAQPTPRAPRGTGVSCAMRP